MVTLSDQVIDMLVGLVEDELVSLSNAGREGSETYRALQNCRYGLLIMASRANRAQATARRRPPGGACHLRAIAGGKA